jgi:hypothetical protein
MNNDVKQKIKILKFEFMRNSEPADARRVLRNSVVKRAMKRSRALRMSSPSLMTFLPERPLFCRLASNRFFACHLSKPETKKKRKKEKKKKEKKKRINPKPLDQKLQEEEEEEFFRNEEETMKKKCRRRARRKDRAGKPTRLAVSFI